MLKVLGAMLIFFAGTMIGFYQSQQYSNRPRHIRALQQALLRLETEISYGMTPLPEALATIGEHTAEPIGALFRMTATELEKAATTTALAWETAVRNVWMRTSMGDAEKEVMLRLGSTLGASDKSEQIKHLRLAASQLQSAMDEAVDEQRRYAKMWRSLGMLGGALLIILMY